MAQKGSISVSRFIDRLNVCFDRNDKEGARECLEFWENEARSLNDEKGLLTVLNEEVGFYRRSGEEDKAMKALSESLDLTERLGLADDLSGATVFINAATTLSSFGRAAEAPVIYEKAAACFEANNKIDSYEYAALLNNRAAAYYALKQYNEAERDWIRAIDVLKKRGSHDGEIAVSLVMLAHLVYERDGVAKEPMQDGAKESAVYEKIEPLLDSAWDFINSDNQPKDGRYADVLLKCAPSFDYFGRDIEAQALRDTADEIYEMENRM